MCASLWAASASDRVADYLTGSPDRFGKLDLLVDDELTWSPRYFVVADGQLSGWGHPCSARVGSDPPGAPRDRIWSQDTTANSVESYVSLRYASVLFSYEHIAAGQWAIEIKVQCAPH